MNRFTLTDAAGKPHTYTVQPHPAGEGTHIVLQVMSLAGEPLGRLIESKAGEFVGLIATKVQSANVDADKASEAELVARLIEMITADDIQRLLGDVPWATIARDVRQGIATMNAPQLIRDVLHYTSRDGHPLSHDGHFDVAFTRNYMELLKAVWRVVQINGFAGFTVSLASDSRPEAPAMESSPSAML